MTDTQAKLDEAVKRVDDLKDLLFDISISAGMLNCALDGEEKYRRLRARVLRDMKRVDITLKDISHD